MQLYWNHASAWVISSKLAAFLQNTFSEEHLRRAASRHLHYNKKHTVFCFLSLSTCIIRQFHSYTQILALIVFIPTPSFPHSHPDSQHFLHYNPHSHHSYPDSLYYHPDFHNSPIISRIPTLIPRIPILIPCILIISFIPFPDSSFRLLQIAVFLRWVSLSKHLQGFKVTYQYSQFERLISDYIWACPGSPKTYCYRGFLEN